MIRSNTVLYILQEGSAWSKVTVFEPTVKEIKYNAMFASSFAFTHIDGNIREPKET